MNEILSAQIKELKELLRLKDEKIKMLESRPAYPYYYPYYYPYSGPYTWTNVPLTVTSGGMSSLGGGSITSANPSNITFTAIK